MFPRVAVTAAVVLLAAACSSVLGLEERQRRPEGGIGGAGGDGAAGAARDGGAGTGAAGGAAGSAVGGAGGSTGGGGGEVCNFIDDDGNGIVDDGWDWKVAPWRPVAQDFGAALRLIELSDGALAFGGVDVGLGPGNDRGIVQRLLPDGLSDGAQPILAPAGGTVTGFGLVTIPDRSRVAAVMTELQMCPMCESGFAYFNAQATMFDQITPLHLPGALVDLAAWDGGFAVALLDEAGTIRIMLLDQDGNVIGESPLTPAVLSAKGSLATHGPLVVGAFERAAGNGLHLVGFDAPAQEVRFSTVAQALGAGALAAARRSVAILSDGSEFAVLYSAPDAMIALFDSGGTMTGGPVDVGVGRAADLLDVGGGLVAVVEEPDTRIRIERLSTVDLSPAASAPAFAEISDEPVTGIAIARSGRPGIVIARSTAGHRLETALVSCP